MEGISFLDVIQLLGGVGIFLYAIKMISESLQLLAGNSLHNLIAMLTKTPVLGVAMGALVTVLIQSSSATTVMTVSFVDAGLMTLNQAVGVIMGANIGTTITGQIVAFKVKDYVYLFVIIGALCSMFGRNHKVKYLGNGLLGFGLLFIGMQTMESAMGVLRSRSDIFLMFAENPFLSLMAGTVLTVLVQSSSATVGLTIALGMQGLLPLEAAIPIILGDNIGTTITAVLAAIGTKRVAKQACFAHVLFNIIGVCIFFPLIPVYVGFIAGTADSIGHQIANAHTFFNVANTLLFLPFVGIFVKIIRRFIPDKPEDSKREIHFLDSKLIEFTPSVAVDAVKNECVYMGSLVLKDVDIIEDIIFNNDSSQKNDLAGIENKLDDILVNIEKYSQQVIRAGVGDTDLLRLHAFVSLADDMERVGDKCKSLISIYSASQKEPNGAFSDDAIQELKQMYMKAKESLEMVIENIALPKDRVLTDVSKIDNISDEVRAMEVKARHWHVERLTQGKCSTTTGLRFLDAIKSVEHMAYRAKKMSQNFTEL